MDKYIICGQCENYKTNPDEMPCLECVRSKKAICFKPETIIQKIPVDEYFKDDTTKAFDELRVIYGTKNVKGFLNMAIWLANRFGHHKERELLLQQYKRLI